MLPALLTTEEVADLFRVSAPTVNKWAREGIITPIRLEGTKRQMFRRDELERLLENPEPVA